MPNLNTPEPTDQVDASTEQAAGEHAWPDRALLAILVTGLVVGVAIGLSVGEPSKLPALANGNLGAILAVALAIWAAIEKWQTELEQGPATALLLNGSRFVGLLTPMVAVGAAIALALNNLSPDQSGLVAGVIALSCVVLLILQAGGLVVRVIRNLRVSA